MIEIQGLESTPRNGELKPTCASETRLQTNGESNPGERDSLNPAGERESLQGFLFWFFFEIKLTYTFEVYNIWV